MFNHSKWPNKLSEAGSDPAMKEELARHCSSNTDDAWLSCKEVNTCMYEVIGNIMLHYFFFVSLIKEWTNTQCLTYVHPIWDTHGWESTKVA